MQIDADKHIEQYGARFNECVCVCVVVTQKAPSQNCVAMPTNRGTVSECYTVQAHCRDVNKRNEPIRWLSDPTLARPQQRPARNKYSSSPLINIPLTRDDESKDNSGTRMVASELRSPRVKRIPDFILRSAFDGISQTSV